MASWTKLVAAGKVAARQEGDAKWVLGDLALEVAPMGSGQAHNGSTETLERYAEEIGVEFDALRQYRFVSDAWPHGTRVARASWTAHRELAGNADRLTLLVKGMTVTQARKANGVNDKARRPLAEQPAEPTTPSERAAHAAAALADPAVKAAALEDPDTYSALMESAASVETERIRRRSPAEPRGKSSGIAVFSLHAEMIAARQRIRNVMKMLPGYELDSEARDGLLADVDTTEDVLRGLRDMLMTGREFDEGLAALLTEEGA